MSAVKVFWDPAGVSVDSLGKKKYDRITDGDTPYITLSIRMLSIDTPEVHYPGNTKPSKHDSKLKDLAKWIQQGEAPIHKGLGKYIQPKIATGKAGTLQLKQGERATKEFEDLLEKKLKRPGKKSKRSVFIRAADEHFDQYGRLLAYMAPSYTKKELANMTFEQRATFNLLMVKNGWAASFPIYPSIPKYADLVLLQKVAKDAYIGKKGVWADPNTLTGYEFRMCIKLYDITKKLVAGKSLSSSEKYGWISRYCVDMTSRKIYYPQDYYKVKPYNRVFIWPKDVPEAVGKMNLSPP